MAKEQKIEIWGGIECTMNRVQNAFFDQCEYAGHYTREGDIDLVASLGISRLRYPVLWEKHQPKKDSVIDWNFAGKSLNRLRECGVEPIAGLVHHGSGPVFVNFFDGSFEEGLAAYARLVAEAFPWIRYYTPVNEPLTTARFCGLYGHWYPHHKNDLSFYRILLSECRATVMAMKAIRQVNPDAQLIQTEDLGKTYSTPLLQHQADLENRRRWLSYDLLCGRVRPGHLLWEYLTANIGLDKNELEYFTINPCIPDVCGFNYYVTSERYLDEDLSKYPASSHGSNDHHHYADVEVVRVRVNHETGAYAVIREAYDHLGLPMAITECHLHCTREEQMRWFYNMWQTVCTLRSEGVDIRALTAWALFGLHGWNNLVRTPGGTYEPGIFHLRNNRLKPTALVCLLQDLARHGSCDHPVLQAEGWWKREERLIYPSANVVEINSGPDSLLSPPLLIIGEQGSHGGMISDACAERNLHHVLLGWHQIENGEGGIQHTLQELQPWAVIHSPECLPRTGSGSGDPNSFSRNEYFSLARFCEARQVKLVSMASDVVHEAGGVQVAEFAGVLPSLATGLTLAQMLKKGLSLNPGGLVVRTGYIFGQRNGGHLLHTLLAEEKPGSHAQAGFGNKIALSFLPDLIHAMLDLLIDNETGTVRLVNKETGSRKETIRRLTAAFPAYAAIRKHAGSSGRGTVMPNHLFHLRVDTDRECCLPLLEDALHTHFTPLAKIGRPKAIAV